MQNTHIAKFMQIFILSVTSSISTIFLFASSANASCDIFSASERSGLRNLVGYVNEEEGSYAAYTIYEVGLGMKRYGNDDVCYDDVERPGFVYELGNDPVMQRVVLLLSKQTLELAGKMDLIRAEIRKQEGVYRNNKNANLLRADLKNLSGLTLKLCNTIKELFAAGGDYLSNLSATRTRSDALSGFRSFTASVNAADSQMKTSLDKSIEAVDQAIRELKVQINR